MKSKNVKKRRNRKFTTPNTLSQHPILLLYGKSEVKDKVLSYRGERGLWFSDFQFLFCVEKSKMTPKNCPSKKDCKKKCKLNKKCPYIKLKVWNEIFKDEQINKMKLYTQKSHLADDLRRLCDSGYLIRVKRGYYELIGTGDFSDTASALKVYLKRLVGKCPADLIQAQEGTYFFFMDKDTVKKHKKDLKDIIEIVDSLRMKLNELTMRSVIVRVADAFVEELQTLPGNREKVYLWRYLKEHVGIQLTNLGLNTELFKDELNSIYNFDIGIDKAKLTEIEKDIEKEQEMVKEAKNEISKAFWIEQAHCSWAKKYDILMSEYVFSLKSEYKDCLNEGRIEESIRTIFKNKKHPLSSNTSISKIENKIWMLTDGSRKYRIENVGAKLKIYKSKSSDTLRMKKIKHILRQHEEFQNWFRKSGMFIPLNVFDENPFIIIDHPLYRTGG
jgi:hypothetical protein